MAETTNAYQKWWQTKEDKMIAFYFYGHRLSAARQVIHVVTHLLTLATCTATTNLLCTIVVVLNTVTACMESMTQYCAVCISSREMVIGLFFFFFVIFLDKMTNSLWSWSKRSMRPELIHKFFYEKGRLVAATWMWAKNTKNINSNDSSHHTWSSRVIEPMGLRKFTHSKLTVVAEKYDESYILYLILIESNAIESLAKMVATARLMKVWIN